jgi:hypothetical protein
MSEEDKDKIREEIAKERIARVKARVEEMTRDENTPQEQKKHLYLMLKRANLWMTDEELLKLPSFSDWFAQTINKQSPQEQSAIKNTAIYLPFLIDMDGLIFTIRGISEKSALYKEDDEQFKLLQRDWWFWHEVIHTMRIAMIKRFNLPPPNPNGLMPDRLLFGTLLSEEDYIFFIAKNLPSHGIVHKGEKVPEPGDNAVSIPVSTDSQASSETVPEERPQTPEHLE